MQKDYSLTDFMAWVISYSKKLNLFLLQKTPLCINKIIMPINDSNEVSPIYNDFENSNCSQ